MNGETAMEDEVKKLISCKYCQLAKYCELCLDHDENHNENICKKIKVKANIIEKTQPTINEKFDVEKYVKFIYLKLDYAYNLWYMAECSGSYPAYERFLKYAIEPFQVKPDNKDIFLYYNNVISSTFLMYYIMVALLNLGYLDEALLVFQHCLNNWYDENQCCKEFNGFSKFRNVRVNSYRDWRHEHLEYLENQRKLERKNSDMMEKIKSERASHSGNEFSFLSAILICIKVATIIEMEQKQVKMKQFFEALANDDTDSIESFKKKYTRLENTKVFEVDFSEKTSKTH